MHAFRCPSCGETRWSPFGIAPRTAPECPICATDMIVERRRPGAIVAAQTHAAERRDVTSHAQRA